MPVLFNKESGLAEDLPKEVANSALASGTHEIPVISPEGQQGSTTPEAAQELIKQGYRQPKTEELKSLLTTAKHSTSTEQAITGMEGLAKGALGPITDVMHQAFEIPLEDVRARAETNPGIHTAGEAVGLIGTGLAGIGQGAVLNKVGSLINAGKDASFIVKVAASAGRGAIENALYQASDETSKWMQNDPMQTAETAISHIGLAATLGAAIGATGGGVSALWDTKAAQKARQFIGDMQGMARQHLEIPNAAPEVSSPTSIYKSDIFGQGVEQPAIDYSTTAGGKAVNAIIKNNLAEQMAGVIGGAAGSIVHHPFIGYLFGKHTIGPAIEKIMPAIMKSVLSTDASGIGLKAALDYGMNAVHGENVLNKAAAAVFAESTHTVEPVSDKERRKLQESLDKITDNQEHLLNVGKDVSYYMPDHAQNLSATAMRASQYLQSLKPKDAPQSPLDSKRELNSSEEAAYNRALDIAQRPLIVTKAIKDGSLTIADIQHMKVMYPNLYSALSQKLTNQLIDKKTDKGAISYKTKLSLSAFMGQPLDSSMQPMAILASQGQGMTAQQQAQPKNGTVPKNMNKLSKIPEQANTMTGSREQYRSSRH